MWLKEASQFATKVGAHIRAVESKRKEAERKNETIEEDLVIVRTLKMKQNCADLEKEKSVNDVLIRKWEEEERELREACAALVPMMECTVCDDETKDGIECVAGIYAVLDVVGVEVALPEEQKNRLGKMIARVREAKRRETSG